MLDASSSVMVLATMIGQLVMSRPYVSHSDKPKHNKKNIGWLKSLADLVFHVLMACGKKATVVQAAAK